MDRWEEAASLPGLRAVLDPDDSSGTKNSLIDRVQRAALTADLAPRMGVGAAPLLALDLGCGTGRLTGLLTGLGYLAVGLDPAMSMLAKTRASGVSAGLVGGDVTQLPLADESFDVIMSVGVLGLIAPDLLALRDALAGCRAALRAGGRLVMIEHVADEDMGRGASRGTWDTAIRAAGLTPTRAEPVRLGDSAIIARCERHPWMARLPGVIGRIRKEAATSAELLVNGRYADYLMVAVRSV